MLVTALLTAVLTGSVDPQPQAANPPQSAIPSQDEAFTSKSVDGITVRYDKSIEIAPADFDALLSSMRLARSVVKNGLGIELPIEPLITVRQVKESKRLFYTDGADKIFFDFPSEPYVTRLQLGDERVVRYALPCYLQLWLYRSLTSTAGLDRRILESLVDYLTFLYKREVERMSPQIKAPEAPTGLGACWHQLETIHPGGTAFILTNLSSLKMPGHLVGQNLRDIAVAVTEDAGITRLFDSITPTEPLLAAEELVPSAPLVAAMQLRTGRLALWNGVPLLDAGIDPIPVAIRVNDFEKIFLMAISVAPDNKVRREPPQIRDIEVWKLYWEFRPRILLARDNFDYHLVLREFLSRFGDRSMSLMPSPAMRVLAGTPHWTSIAGIKIGRSGDRFYVARVTPESAPAKAGLVGGLELTAIDGRAPDRVLGQLADFVRQFDSCPSVQRAEAVALDQLLTGKNDSECTLTLRDPTKPKGKAYDVKLMRVLPPNPKPSPPSVTLDAREDQIGVVKIHSFAGDSLQRFAAIVDDCNKRGLKGIVIDLRGNEGFSLIEQNQRYFSAMLGRLLPVDAGKIVIGTAVRRQRAQFEKSVATEIVIERTPGANPFGGRLCLLVDAWTGGESEWFALGFQQAKLGPVIGTTTAGSVTVPKPFDPKNESLTTSGIDISLPSSAVYWPDGSLLQSRGVSPQIEVTQDPVDMRIGRDTQLERAAAVLLQSP
ncbi:MAG: hypothetical protein EXS13_04635 [Planctomycetes bacterium]|nr:hypothetical protein [Planctomycetota bacterium]